MPPFRLSPASRLALELDPCLAVVSCFAATDLGRRAIRGLAPPPDRQPWLERRTRLTEMKALLADGAVVASDDRPLAPLLSRLGESEGERIEGPDFLRLAGFLEEVAEARRRIVDLEARAPSLAAVAGTVPDLGAFRAKIRRTFDRRGRIREDASPRLASLRQRIRSQRDELYSELAAVAGSHREALSEDTVSLAGDRLVLLFRSEAKRRMPGLVHGRSGSGRSVYFEPLEVVEGNNRLQEAASAASEEEARVLGVLRAELAARREEVLAAGRFLEGLDLLQGITRFAVTVGAILPEDGPTLRLGQARHPLLDPLLASARETVLGAPGHTDPIVPLDVELGTDAGVLVITGPNAGGKTVALKTVGLLAVLSRCGMPVPAAEGSVVPFFDAVVATVGDDQDLLAEQSTFSGRLLRLKEAWDESGPATLVLLDELGAGTDPEEGAALAISLIEGLVARGARGALTTHLVAVAAAALELPGASCAAMEWDESNGCPRYRLLPGPPGASRALALARRLGLDPELVARAEARLSPEQRDLRRLLAEVEDTRRRLVAARVEAEERLADLELRAARLEAEERRLMDERRTVARRMTAELELFRRSVREGLEKEVARLAEQLRAGRRRGLAVEATGRLFEEAPAPPVVEETDVGGELEVGATVRHRGWGWSGRLEELDGRRAVVVVAGKRVTVSREELRSVVERDQGRGAARAWVETPEVGDPPLELKLIGRRVEEALAELDLVLDQALLANRSELRVVHGHGTGRLRTAVREHLRGHPAVASARAGGPGEGGDGATVVLLRG